MLFTSGILYISFRKCTNRQYYWSHQYNTKRGHCVFIFDWCHHRNIGFHNIFSHNHSGCIDSWFRRRRWRQRWWRRRWRWYDLCYRGFCPCWHIFCDCWIWWFGNKYGTRGNRI